MKNLSIKESFDFTDPNVYFKYEASHYKLIWFSDTNDGLFYNQIDGSEFHVTRNSLSMLKSCFYKVKEIKSTHFYYKTCTPRMDKTFTNNGKAYWNSWKNPETIYGKNIEEMPKCYEIFWKRFFQDDESYNYWIKWLANSLVRKNGSYVCFISTSGTGKTLTYQISSLLHLEENSLKANSQFLSNKNNGAIEGKTLFFLDELKIENDIQMQQFKEFTNEDMLVEDKYVKTKNIKQYASVIIASNKLKCIRDFNKKDRRISILNVTETPMVDWMDNVDSFAKNELLNMDNIIKLYRYLRTIECEDVKQLITEKTEIIQEANKTEWEKELDNIFESDEKEIIIPISKIKESLFRVSSSNKLPSVQTILDYLKANYINHVVGHTKGNSQGKIETISIRSK